MRNTGLYLTCFVTGAVILILEVLGFRLLAPFFGYSVYVSGTLVGAVLLFLSVGYYAGGNLADRRPTDKVVYQLILVSAGYLAIVYLTYPWFLAIFQKSGLILGALLSTIVIYGVPVTLMSMVSPYLIRLVAENGRIGSSAGSIYAVSTLGSISGTFLATFLLVPFWGSSRTFALCVAVLILLAVAGLWKYSRWFLAWALLLLVLLLPQYSDSETNLVYETESVYNLIRVYDQEGTYTLVLNDPRWKQSYGPDFDNLWHTYREHFNLGPLIVPVEDVLILGLGAGTSALELRHFFDIRVDGVEIDPEVVKVAERYFGVVQSNDFRIFAVDAKSFLTDSNKKYDFIEIDLFHGGPEIPFYVATQEFFRQVQTDMTENGIVMMNILGSVSNPQTNMLTLSIANTVATVFPSVFLFEMGGNTILLALHRGTTLSAIREVLGAVRHPVLRVLAGRMKAGLVEFRHTAGIPVLTDNRAPVEHLTQQVLQNLE